MREKAETAPPSLGPAAPWVETRVGGWVFVSAILVAPPLMVALPLALRGILRSLGILSGPSAFYDTIPLVAAYAVPYSR